MYREKKRRKKTKVPFVPKSSEKLGSRESLTGGKKKRKGGRIEKKVKKPL